MTIWNSKGIIVIIWVNEVLLVMKWITKDIFVERNIKKDKIKEEKEETKPDFIANKSTNSICFMIL